jgi:hypothetical protein
MFGIESGSQKILDRLKKGQTLEQIETAVQNAKQSGIEIVHGFFVVGSPDETAEDMRQTFDFAARIRIDSFGFNRLCVYRGTPLWTEYLQRGLVDDERDWYKYFKCSSIDPTVLVGEEIHRVRPGIRRLILYKFTPPGADPAAAAALHAPHALRDDLSVDQAVPGPKAGDEGRGPLAAVEHGDEDRRGGPDAVDAPWSTPSASPDPSAPGSRPSRRPSSAES